MLKVEAVSKIFSKGSANERLALDNVSISFKESEFVTVIGGNGAGKSTLLNCISGTCDLDKGVIILDGEDISFIPEYKRSIFIGRVFQDPLKGTAYNMSIEENLAIACGKGKRRGFGAGLKKSDIKIFREAIAHLGLGLEDRMKQRVGLLSGGQRQALTLLMATIAKPRLLLLDEHTAALDPYTAKRVLDITREIVEHNKLCTVMITHNMKDALAYGNRTVMMREGKVLLDIKGSEREEMTVEKLVLHFGVNSDRLLLG
ncbi:putative ABC transport system ATP-binding protein [Ruminiclostridium sufflavum DSM 19573]|uniref:Putative ABC transport system ATP-binding protein n=1 Tax=Ruminiclostridium sufflavum DSM 19573 TaxID=1121337 RepID=A0A318YC78_9FIRM|nr:ATP-binding cassette domain-containing protein [Ruminiclostridium sufflavum]PYG90222.1 putative ABC transport system ATP-binding protein [Ruminiclostridium sufflavum DSM 19573]